MHRQPVHKLLDDYLRRFPAEAEVVKRFQEFVDAHEDCFERTCRVGHITGSAWLINRARTHVLLTHHRKLERWLQLGGHSDGDPDPLAVALSEAREESGLLVEPISTSVFDLDIHEIPPRGDDPAHYHFDIRFSLQTVSGEDFAVSAESFELAWVLVDGLAEYTDEFSMLRMRDKWLAA